MSDMMCLKCYWFFDLFPPLSAFFILFALSLLRTVTYSLGQTNSLCPWPRFPLCNRTPCYANAVVSQKWLWGSLCLLKKCSLLCLYVGPGLSIRVICAEEPFICKDFTETNNILKIITDFSASIKKVSVTELQMHRTNVNNYHDYH